MNESIEIVEMINDLLQDSKYFLIEAKKHASRSVTAFRYNKAAILFAWAGFEGWLNKSCLDFATNLNDLSIHEKGFLSEKKVELKKGGFSISNSDKYESYDVP